MKQVLALATLLLAMVGGIAQADPRSDVKAGFNRCDVFADDRTWLNCIYGAVQPMRGKLGLPPAPDSQTNLVPSASLMPQAAPLPSASPSLPLPPPMDRRQNTKRGGAFSFLTGGEHVVTNMPMTAFSIDHEGLFTVTLANGQVWREIEGSPKPRWRDPASRYKVSISTGTMNSYNLIIVGEEIQYKAKRVQ
jgi:hypothetical protein